MQTVIRDLHRRRGRERRGLALAEGVRLVEEALAAAVPLRGAAVADTLEGTERGRALLAALERSGTRLERVTADQLAALADTEQPQGVVAVIEPRRWTLDDVRLDPRGVVLALDAVQDPGNVGTIIRTALGLGAAGVLALKGTAELTNPKVLRGSMGAAFRVPCVATDDRALLAWAREREVAVWVADADGEPIARAARSSAAVPARVALVLGNEGAGVSAAVADGADRRVAIPLAPAAESLNVAVAAGILLYEVTQRG